MKRRYFFLFFILSFSLCHAKTVTRSEKEKIKFLMISYLHGIHKKDQKKLKSLTSKSYYLSLKKNYIPSKVKQGIYFHPKKIIFEILKSHMKENEFWVNMKEKIHDKFSNYWYIVQRKNKKYLILKMVHREE